MLEGIMTTHTFNAFRATDKKDVLTLVNKSTTVTMTFNHIGETLSYRPYDDDPSVLSPVFPSPKTITLPERKGTTVTTSGLAMTRSTPLAGPT